MYILTYLTRRERGNSKSRNYASRMHGPPELCRQSTSQVQYTVIVKYVSVSVCIDLKQPHQLNISIMHCEVFRSLTDLVDCLINWLDRRNNKPTYLSVRLICSGNSHPPPAGAVRLIKQSINQSKQFSPGISSPSIGFAVTRVSREGKEIGRAHLLGLASFLR